MNSDKYQYICTRRHYEVDNLLDCPLLDSSMNRESGGTKPQLLYLMDRESLPKRYEDDFSEKKSIMSQEDAQKFSIQSSQKAGFHPFNRYSNFQEYQKVSIEGSLRFSIEPKQSLEMKVPHDWKPSLESRYGAENKRSIESVRLSRQSKKDECEIVCDWQEPTNTEQYLEELINKLTIGKEPKVVDRPTIMPQLKTGCICRKTRCLKQYCQCFQSGKLCTDSCECVDCQNNDEHKEQVELKRLEYSQKNPEATECRCTCKKSHCVKKYCECFLAGQKCGINCNCKECFNLEYSKEELLRQPQFLEEGNQKKMRLEY